MLIAVVAASNEIPTADELAALYDRFLVRMEEMRQSVRIIKQALEHPQVAARNMLIDVPDGSGGTLKLAGNPLKMSAFDDPKTRRPAPDLDSDREAILSFIGAGTPLNIPSWGNIMAEARSLFQLKPWLILIPGAFLSLTVLAVNLLGDGLRDALDPRLARRM